MREFKVGDLVKVEGDTWTIVKSIGECVYTLQSGVILMHARDDMMTLIAPTPEEIEWGPWVELSEGRFIAADLYQSECKNRRVIRYRLPLPKPEPVVTVREQWLRFDEYGDLGRSLGSISPNHFRARITRTTLDGEEIDVKIEVLK